jgi:hypothetical protein
MEKLSNGSENIAKNETSANSNICQDMISTGGTAADRYNPCMKLPKVKLRTAEYRTRNFELTGRLFFSRRLG